MTSAEAIRVTRLSKVHGRPPHHVVALDEVDLVLHRGTFTAITGPSGSGKTTLLQCMAGLDRPTGGEIRLGGTRIDGLSERELTRLRRGRVGFVFQGANLLTSLTAEQNASLPPRLAGRRVDPGTVRRLLADVGLGDRLRHRPGELSGGQRQRVAIARALATSPEVLFADEPTGALDSATGRQVLGLLRSLVNERGQTVVVVTHDPVAASFADRVTFLADGRVSGHLDAPTPRAVAELMTASEVG
ncbi:ABC transporter ATP-binding protein [Saccharothrix syringae]|uniref:ABC transporter ATP-binding protein n=1 Tax=Saccharothrix syringae TaxID=103733 RepID=A0A5Q0GV19_SACSY|nr:ABC transporter ATP-binding protein [Saccharothrix syringae]QFZ17809.1 ABC transporter ATP-binding protein [Saccharothrix syringae]